MSKKPIATVTSMHVCPMVTGTVPHVGGPIVGPGAPNVLINGKPVALMGDMCTCAGPPDTIVTGNPSVLVNGVPVACLGDMTAHGGSIVMGEPNVLVSTSSPQQSAVMKVKDIPFPKITIIDRTVAFISGKAEMLKVAEEKQAEIREMAEKEVEPGEPEIYNLQWKKEQLIVRASKVLKQVTLTASVKNIADGETVKIRVKAPSDNNNEGSEEVIELSGTVSDKKVEVIWEVEDIDQK